MRIRTTTAAVLAISTFALAPRAEAQSLETFGVLAGSEITNTGPTVINGNIGLSPGSAITGFPPGSVVFPYTRYVTNGVAVQAKADLTTAYNVLAGRPATASLTAIVGSGQSLNPGVYSFDSSAQINGELTLDGGGDPDAVFIFNIPSTLTTGSNAKILLVGGANPNNVFFRVGSSATLGTATEFQGRILALTSITLNTGANISCGAALARNAAVTLDTNRISVAEALEAEIGGMYVDCAMVEVVIGDELDEMASDSAQDVADVIDDYVAGGGDLPLGFQVLDFLTPAELADALAQIAGEASTGVTPTGTQAMDSFLDTVLNQGFGGDSGPGGPSDQTAPGRDTLMVLGYATPENSKGADANMAMASGGALLAAPDPRRWGVWAALYGGDSDVDGNAASGTRDRSSDNYGVVFGLNYQITEDTTVGLALSGGATSYSLADGFGNGSSNMFQGAIYSRTNLDAAYIAAALAYAYHDESTERTTAFDGARYTADFDASNIAGHVEAGYRFGGLTPYGAVRVQVFHTPDYSETSDTGAFALDYDEQTTTTTRTELGTRFDHAFAVGYGASLTLSGRVAWAHDYSSQPSTTATFQALPGSDSFTVDGAAAERDSVLLSAGAEFMMASGFSLAGSVNSQFAENSQTYSGNARIRFQW
uniref:ice-binding family protein n=1 Tax=Pararhizobium sp. IMCC3301 TaxID=3067904 RepID=UPI002740E61E|nr:ice-binding family protein [Pararhizobium sp. IMCC3301]